MRTTATSSLKSDGSAPRRGARRSISSASTRSTGKSRFFRFVPTRSVLELGRVRGGRPDPREPHHRAPPEHADAEEHQRDDDEGRLQVKSCTTIRRAMPTATVIDQVGIARRHNMGDRKRPVATQLARTPTAKARAPAGIRPRPRDPSTASCCPMRVMPRGCWDRGVRSRLQRRSLRNFLVLTGGRSGGGSRLPFLGDGDSENELCPACGRRLPFTFSQLSGSGLGGTMVVTHSRPEYVAACSVDGSRSRSSREFARATAAAIPSRRLPPGPPRFDGLASSKSDRSGGRPCRVTAGAV